MPDPVWSHREHRRRLQASDGNISGGDASLRAQYTHLATRGGLALGGGSDDAFRAWLAAVRDYLKEERSPWYTEDLEVEHVEPGPIERRELVLSTIRPQPHRRLTDAEDPELTERVEAIRRNGPNALFSVLADDQGYMVIDDELEHLKYWACVQAKVTSLTCAVRVAGDIGTTQTGVVVELDCISVASAELCGRLETEALAQQLAPPVEQRVTPPDRSATSAPMTTPRTRRDRVDDFLARCNRECQGPDKLTRKDIWTVAHHATARQFERWQKNDKHATKTDHKNFERILGMAPQAFIHYRAKKQRPS